MSICNSGMDCKLSKVVSVVIDVTPRHPLMKLMNTIDWEQLSKLIMPDLKKSTSKLKWWLGRKLKMRIHLGVYLLQQLLNETDRGIERQVRDNAVYAVFCGKLFVHNWTVPDHKKIEEFRSRLSPATINLLLKTAIVGRRIQKILKRKIPDVVKDHIPEIDMKLIKGLARQHYFEKRKAFKQRRELRKEVLSVLWKHVSIAVDPVVRFARIIAEPFILESLPKRDKNLITHFIRKAPAILTELFERCYENASRKTKTFSYNRDEVACFNRDKHHKPLEFGRQFQIGRVGGNFVYSIPNDSISMPDAASVKKMLIQHIELFQNQLNL